MSMEKTIILALGLFVLANILHTLDAQDAIDLVCRTCDSAGNNEFLNENPHSESVDNNDQVRQPRSVNEESELNDSEDTSSFESTCSSKINDFHRGHCVEAKKCFEAFEAPIENCNSRESKQAVCCFNNSRADETKLKSSSRGLEEIIEPKRVSVGNFRIPSESANSDTKIIGYSFEQHNQFAEAMQSISESIEKGKTSNSDSKQLLDMNVGAAAGQLTKFGYTDTKFIDGIRYLDAMHYFLSERSNLSLGPMIRNRPHPLSEFKLDFVCQPEPGCDRESSYRTFDGSCNNLEYPQLGRANTAYDRLMLPYYDDGFQAMREKGVKGDLLPGAREVSLVSFGVMDGQSDVISQMGVFFSQFIAHDMSSAALEELSFDPFSPVDCCKQSANSDSIKQHFDCAPIKVPPLDPFYGLFKKCLNFVRNIQAPPSATNCMMGPRQQLSKVTQWLDLSVVYGNSVNDSKNMRDPRTSALLVSSSKKSEQQDIDGPYIPHDVKGFKMVGDKRANQSPMLSILHIVFFRLHNKLVRSLHKLNRHWSNERLFQEARRINIAIYQRIVFKEFLPILIGQQALKQFNIELNSETRGHTEVYDAQLKYGGALNEFAHGAFRLHNIIWGLFQTKSDSGKLTRVPTPIWLLFQQGQLVCQRHVFKGTLNAMLMDEGGNWDANMPDDIHGRLFETPLQLVGHDLLSLDIQRGRDHGLPSYAKVREACGLGTLRRWSQLDSILQFGAGLKLRLVYSNIQDIDLIVGGQLELAMEGAVVGPTFACMIAEQMRRTRYGDRYFFDNKHQPHPFTQEQLSVISKQASMSSILCHTTTLSQAQPNAFGVISEEKKNTLRDCKQYSFLQLEAWRDTSGGGSRGGSRNGGSGQEDSGQEDSGQKGSGQKGSGQKGSGQGGAIHESVSIYRNAGQSAGQHRQRRPQSIQRGERKLEKSDK